MGETVTITTAGDPPFRLRIRIWRTDYALPMPEKTYVLTWGTWKTEGVVSPNGELLDRVTNDCGVNVPKPVAASGDGVLQIGTGRGPRFNPLMFIPVKVHAENTVIIEQCPLEWAPTLTLPIARYDIGWRLSNLGLLVEKEHTNSDAVNDAFERFKISNNLRSSAENPTKGKLEPWVEGKPRAIVSPGVSGKPLGVDSTQVDPAIVRLFHWHDALGDTEASNKQRATLANGKEPT